MEFASFPPTSNRLSSKVAHAAAGCNRGMLLRRLTRWSEAFFCVLIHIYPAFTRNRTLRRVTAYPVQSVSRRYQFSFKSRLFRRTILLQQCLQLQLGHLAEEVTKEFLAPVNYAPVRSF